MSVSLRKQRDKPSENRIFKKDKKMVTIYNTTLSATSQRHFSDSLGGALRQGLSERGASAGGLQLFQNIMSFL